MRIIDLSQLFFIFIFSFIFSLKGLSASNENLNTILDLESKVSQKIREIIAPVDSEAIVIARVQVKKINTDLAGTQMSAVGIMSTADIHSIEESDIQTISVSIISSIDPFPKDIKILAENTLKDFSKKGQIKIIKMNEGLSKAILDGNRNKQELVEKSKNGWQKTGELAEKLTQFAQELPTMAKDIKKDLTSVLMLLAALYGLIHLVILIVHWLTQRSSIKNLSNALSTINLNSTQKSDSEKSTFETKRPKDTEKENTPKNTNGAFSSRENPIEPLDILPIRDLLADCYWCEKDNYAAWVWSQLSPGKRLKVIDAWGPIIDYVRFFTRLEATPEAFHLDPIYLSAHQFYRLSNEDLLKLLKGNPTLWSEISILRQKTMKLSLKERLDFLNQNSKSVPTPFNEWPSKASSLRTLITPFEVTELTIDDERMILKNPNLIPQGYRNSIHSLVWVAMLPEPQREKLLQRYSAQLLAEIWTGPDEILELLFKVIPEKKRELLESYLKRSTPSRENPALNEISDQAQNLLKELSVPVNQNLESQKAKTQNKKSA